MKLLSALLDHVQSANGVVVELRCLPAELHLVFMVSLTVDGELSVLHCQRFFLCQDLCTGYAYLVVVEVIIVNSH